MATVSVTDGTLQSTSGCDRPRKGLTRTLLLALLTACNTACNPSARPPKSPSEGCAWTAITTAHFVVVTDLDESDARMAVANFETELEELRAVAFPRKDRVPRLTIVVFRNDDERFAFRSGATGAEYIDRLRGDIERSPTIVLTAVRYASEQWLGRRTFLHELTHRYVHQAYGSVPVWFNEGLADYLSTMTVEDGKATLGAVPLGYQLTRGYTASVAELLSVTPSAFYGWRETTVAGEAARNHYYRSAWALVHFLQNGPPAVRAQFAALIGQLDAGRAWPDAWRETLGAIPQAAIEQSFAEYTTTTERWTGVELPIRPSPPLIVEGVRSMSDEDVHLLWARLSDPRLPETDPRSSEAQIADAARIAPRSPEVLFRQGCSALERGRRREARERFEQALATSPEEPRYLLGALRAVIGPDMDAGGQSKVDAWLTRLATTARTADELGMVARLEAARGDDAAALAHAEASISADPGYYGGFAARAFVRERASRHALAVADEQRAVALAAEHGEDLAKTFHEDERATAAPPRTAPDLPWTLPDHPEWKPVAVEPPFAPDVVSFLNDAHRRIHGPFSDDYLQAVLDHASKSDPRNDGNLVVVLHVVIGPAGVPTRAEVAKSSGVEPFDRQAWDAFMRAAPLGSTPAALRSPDGNTYLSWALFRDPVHGCVPTSVRFTRFEATTPSR